MGRAGARRRSGPTARCGSPTGHNFIAQHNPTPPGYSNGKGNAYESTLRDHARGRIYRISYRNAPPAKRWSLSKSDPVGLGRGPVGRQHVLADHGAAPPRRARAEGRRAAAARASSATRPSTRSGSTAARCMRSGRCTDSAPWPHRAGEAHARPIGALKHPAAGVRKVAAMVLPKTAESAAAIVDAGLLRDPDLHTRLAATLAIADMPPAPAIADALYAGQPGAGELHRPMAQPRALHRRHPAPGRVSGDSARRTGPRRP